MCLYVVKKIVYLFICLFDRFSFLQVANWKECDCWENNTRVEH